jgi:hypothetical protein
MAVAHGLAQIDVGGGEDAHIHLNLLDAAEVHEAAVLQHAQNLGLRVHAHGRNLVEKERAAVGHFEQAFLGRDRRSERALDVAEERRLQQLRRHGAGVDGHEGLVAARRVGVDGLGDNLLARAALALNQNRRPAGRHLRHQVEDAQHDFALAHDVGEVVALLEGALELKIFFFGAWRATAERMSASSFSLSQGFWTKFSAPARMASTTLSTVPYAVIMMTGNRAGAP